MKVVLVIEFNQRQYSLMSKDTVTLKHCILLISRSLVVVHFWAPWAPQCVQMNDVMAELAKEHPQVSFVKVVHLGCHLIYEADCFIDVREDGCRIPCL